MLLKCFAGAFNLYDIDQDGYISRAEMLDIIDGIYQMVGNTVEFPLDENTPEKRVDMIFKQMDVVCDIFKLIHFSLFVSIVCINSSNLM